MKRKCIILERSLEYNRAIGVDLAAEEDIVKTLMENAKYRRKLNYVFRKILEQPNMYFDNYKRILLSHKEAITEIRLFPNGDNCRIYCKEITLNDTLHCIIMAVLVDKKEKSEDKQSDSTDN